MNGGIRVLSSHSGLAGSTLEEIVQEKWTCSSVCARPKRLSEYDRCVPDYEHRQGGDDEEQHSEVFQRKEEPTDMHQRR